jgi:hypothetical protein
MARRKRRGAINANDRTIAEAEADLRVGPQISQIRDLYDQAARQKVSDIRAAQQGAQSAIAFANAQRPTVKTTYKTGQNVANAAAADVETAFGKLGAAADPYRAVTSREQGGARNRINEARIGALQELTERATGAKAGMALAINQARSDYALNRQQLNQKLSDLLGQRGTTIAGRLATLSNQRAERAAKIRTAKIGAGATTEAAKIRAQAQKESAERTASKGERATALQRGTFSDEVGAAMSRIRQLLKDNPGVKRPQLATTLLKGQQIPKGGDPNAQIKQVSQLAASIALDQVLDKHVSQQNAQRLHQRGLKVADIADVRTRSEWLPGAQAQQRRQAAKRRREAAARRRRQGTVFGTSPFGGAFG